jgi:hypothetical protein
MTANQVSYRRRPTLCQVGLTIAILAATTSLSSAGSAVGTAAQEAACGGDVMRFCLSAYPNMSRLKACMIVNWSNLSQGCRTVLQNG